MKNLNLKTGLTRKGGVFTGAVMTLVAATVLSMAPTSQAFAWGYTGTPAPVFNIRGGDYTVFHKGYANNGFEAFKIAKASRDKAGCNIKYNGKDLKGTSKSGTSQPTFFAWTGTDTKGRPWFEAHSPTKCTLPKPTCSKNPKPGFNCIG